MNISTRKNDQIVMSLVHYFVTKENYSPINVKGVRDEVWLENLDSDCKIIRITSKYIHNDEQLNFDLKRMENVVKQIKRKTLSLKMDAINICMNINEDVKVNDNSFIKSIVVNDIDDAINNDYIKNTFPDMKDNINTENIDIEKIIKLTNDINNKTENENKVFEKIFSKDKLFVTKIIIGLCILIYLIPGLNILLANNKLEVLSGKWYLLFTCMFAHANLFHLLVNMYSLYIIGEQVENFFGKIRFLIIYILSGLSGSLLSVIFLNGYSVGASGAIFGLLGSLLYFGYHYRLYLAGNILNQIVPIIIINLFIGFMYSSIDNFAHIGGLIGGYLTTMIVGIPGKNNKREWINGLIVFILYVLFLIYLLLFR